MLRDFNPLRPSVLDSLTLGYFSRMKRDYVINIGTKKIVTLSLCGRRLTHSENVMQHRDFIFCIRRILSNVKGEKECTFLKLFDTNVVVHYRYFEFCCIFLLLIYNCFLYLSNIDIQKYLFDF